MSSILKGFRVELPILVQGLRDLLALDRQRVAKENESFRA